MHLTRQENEMLEGKHGYPAQKSMEILVSLGECFDAERMIPVTSVHLGGSSATGADSAGIPFIEEMASKGGKYIPFTDINPASVDPWLWKDIGISEELVRKQIALTNLHAEMGAFTCNSCTPYLLGHVPRLGAHIAWLESSAIIFANSVLGARTNKEGGPSGLAAAFTGRTPEYGYHLDRHRHGNLEFKVTAKLNDPFDYGTLGYFAGKIAEDGVPVFSGILPSVSWDELKSLGSSAATSGGVALFHVIGVTPEAPTEKAAFGPRKARDWPIFEFGEKELQETEESLSKATARDVDIVVFGCPHASIGEIRSIAQLLSGKKLKSGVELWILTSSVFRMYAERMGYLQAIETSGARVLSEMCPVLLPQDFLKERGYKTMATDSAKMTFYATGTQGVSSYYGSVARCVEAAISGVWG